MVGALPFAFLASILLFGASGLGKSFNVTIDDAVGDELSGAVPSYAAARGATWSARSRVQPCAGCLAQPDPSQAFLNTWHDETSGAGQVLSNVTFSFTGTAIYVFGITAEYIPFATTDTHLSFFIDKELVGVFNHIPNISSTDYHYDHLFYYNISIPSGRHEVIVANHGDVAPGSLLMFDYAIYTTSDDPVSASSTSSASLDHNSSATLTVTSTSTPTAITFHKTSSVAIIAGAAAGVGSSAIVVILLWLWIRRRRQSRSAYAVDDPGPGSPSFVATLDPYVLPGNTEATWAVPAGELGTAVTSEHLATLAPGSNVSSLPRGPATASDSAAGSETKTKHEAASSAYSSSIPTDVPTSAGISRSVELEDEVNRLREEVERLRANEAPPPVYDALSPTTGTTLSS